MNPIYVVLTTGGKLYVTANRADALAVVAGKVWKVSGLPGTPGTPKLLTTLSGAGSPYTITDATGVARTGTYVTGGEAENQ